MQRVPAQSEFITVIFNAVEKGNKTSENEVIAIAEVVARLYDNAEKARELMYKQDCHIRDLMFKLERC